MKKNLYIEFIAMCAFVFGCVGCNLAPGSYPYAEIYNLNTNENNLISAIKKFKTANPEYKVPSIVGLIDGRSSDVADHWYHVYFYNKADNEIIYTWIRQLNKEEVSFAFVSINKGLELGNWNRVNKDYQKKENKQKIKKFEEQILDEIKRFLE
ncbi:hypothetical protein [Saccharicrinis fermentans]|uniref:Lipoprotein n=1 Tax=Saccharicrinis fermentans DSM 9555 = JCM 21142 TaxID=869213 RepID=W7YBF6_9BACT|nr:hypothetical protein [Saccharicrinis fermentans]GAF05767.1 hypothetical protein JCM21142_104519 [Saccharicrinis fermentans DSM 9555 = JCM 21142]